MIEMIDCPQCNGTGRVPAVDAAKVEVELAALEAARRERGFAVTPDGRVSEATAATLVGRAPGTLRNWRNGAGPVLPFYKMHGRYTYKLTDIAAYLAASRAADF